MTNQIADELLLEISNCRNFFDDKTDCNKMIMNAHTDMYLPVPWQGHIVPTRILFISSNPSPLKNGCLPLKDWPSLKISDFFECRFCQRREHAKYGDWAEEGIRYRIMPESPVSFNSSVPYWRDIKKTAEVMLSLYLLGNKRDHVVPGCDYAITEIVHCYSKNQVGVRELKRTCSEKYFKRIIELPARDKVVFAVVGEHAREHVNKLYDLDLKIGDIVELNILRKQRLLVALPHPGYFTDKGGKKGIEYILKPEDLKRIQEFLRE
jgi:hypothetical protein